MAIAALVVWLITAAAGLPLLHGLAATSTLVLAVLTALAASHG